MRSQTAEPEARGIILLANGVGAYRVLDQVVVDLHEAVVEEHR